MAAPGDELHDIADPQPLLPGIHVPLWFWIAVIAIACAAVTIVAFLILHRRKPELPSDRSLIAESREAIEKLRASLPGRSLAEVATDASLILRHYLAASLQEPALYETHEEFIMRSDALAALPTGARDRLAPLLDRLASAKYAPSAPDEQTSAQLVDSCLAVLLGLESTRDRQVA